MSSLATEIRQAVRALLARPAWTIAALLCLAIGTGANTATFALINGVLLRPLPFDEPRQIVMMAVRWSRNQTAGPVSVGEFRELRTAGLPFQQLAVRSFLPVGVAFNGPARMVQAEFVGGEYFDLLRVRPLAGRLLSAQADRPGAVVEAVLSERLWRMQFNRDPAVVGKTVRVNGRPVVVAGVAPSGFVGAMRIIAADLWMPASAFGAFASPEAPRDAESRRVFGLIARLRPDVTLNQTRSQVDSVLANRWRTGDSAPESLIEEATGFGVPPGVRSVAAKGSALLFALMGMLVAVAIANVAGLMLARATGRQKEAAVRLALGASRYRIVRQILVESLLLAGGGALLGGLLALALPSLLTGLGPSLPEHLNFAVDIRPDWRTGVYSALTALIVAVLFGLAPARQAAKTDTNLALRESGGNTRTRGASRTLNAFVVGQVAVSTVLLMAAILLGRTWLNTESVDPGIDIRNTLAMSLDWDQSGLDRTKGRAFYEQLLARVASMPGVEHAALTRHPPLSPGGTTMTASVDGVRTFTAGSTGVTSAYFDVVRLPLRQGRNFTALDNGSHAVAIVSETMARQISPDGSPIGKTFSARERRLEVIGVVRDARYRSLSEPPLPVFYEPFAQAYSPQMSLVVRSASDARGLIEPIRREVTLQNADLAAVTIRTLEEQFRESAAPSRQRAMIVAGTCGLGLLLSAFGLFGVMSYGVRLRVRELGVRIAIGARPGDVALLVLKQAGRLVGIGMAVGLLLAFGAARVIASALFGVEPHDPVTLVLVPLVLGAVAAGAAYAPARWATRVDPMRSIRAE